MTDLITRLSKLDAPDRGVDAAVFRYLAGNPTDHWFSFGEDHFTDETVPRITGSTDAVIALARRLYPDVMYRVGNDGEGPDPILYLGELFIPGEQKDSYFTGLSPVDAASLCIALLRAKEASK